MTHAQAPSLGYVQRGPLLAGGLILGAALALATVTAGLGSWAAAVGLGFTLAVLAGIVQRCST